MNRLILIVSLAAAVLQSYAAPEISVTGFDGRLPKKVKVDYTLSEDAIVTMEVLDDGVPIGAGHVRTLSGDVNVRVAAGERSIVWNARTDWPDRSTEKLSVRLTAWPLDAPPWFMSVKINGTVSDIRYYADKASVPGGTGDVRYKTDYLLFRRIPAAGKTVRLGSLPGTEGRADDDVEKPHYVSFAYDYYIGVYEVTQAQYVRVLRSDGSPYENPSVFNPDAHPISDGDAMLRPVENITYINLRGYVSWPSAREPGSGYWLSCLANQIGGGVVFDLPTEARWEYACSGADDETPDIDAVSWYKDNSGGVTHPVGLKDPNGFDLHDMLGNVNEWCLDFANPDYAFCGLQQCEPDGPASKHDYGIDSEIHRSTRGGSCSAAASKIRASYRWHLHYNKKIEDYGFRLTAPAVVTW